MDSQQSWVETTVRGPGTLSFWWKVSSQATGDTLSLLTNGVVVTNISGTVGWQQVSLGIAPGASKLRWNYVKDGSISEGSDAGWLDQVSYSVPTFSISGMRLTNGVFFFNLNGTAGQQLSVQSSTNLTQWTTRVTSTLTSSTTNYTDLTPSNTPAQFYRAVFINQ